MKHLFIPYEEALALKQLDFDEPCFATYRKDAASGKAPFDYSLDFHTKVEMDHNLAPRNSQYVNDWISAPLYQQAFQFFREKYNLHGYKTNHEWFQTRNTRSC